MVLVVGVAMGVARDHGIVVVNDGDMATLTAKIRGIAVVESCVVVVQGGDGDGHVPKTWLH